MADRGEQRAAHPVGLGERAGLARRLGEVGVLERRLELRDDHVEQAPVGGLQVAAVQLEVARGASSPTGSADDAAVGHRLAVGGEHRAVGVEQPHAGHPERLARAADQRRHGALAAQHAAGDRREQLRLGGGARWPTRVRRAAWSTT